MRSMTGLGIGSAPLGDGRLVVEIRSLNHRFLDVRVRLPSEFADLAFFVEQLARERLTRGRYDIGVRTEGAALPPMTVALERAKAVYEAMGRLRDELAPGTELPVAFLASLPELVVPIASSGADEVRNALKAGLESGLARLDEMRSAEGEALASELKGRLTNSRRLRERVAERSSELVDTYRSRLEERLGRLLADAKVQLEKGRMETELAILADRSDVTEELVRLESHFDQFEKLLGSGEPVGRRLDFLLQEVGREANTVGSKIQDAAVSHVVVDLKAEVERMREQVQNVE